ncbi:hypothetical protein E2C01_051480 [Portunus trituberculatus]|uniref:Uncharacterized protein n=1 Tax=Portunus trituberculatus TaxID=210409 RepID=A0A5B7GJ09_PORTR|nr:hypothetical protein [Portunus trituberculatus]
MQVTSLGVNKGLNEGRCFHQTTTLLLSAAGEGRGFNCAGLGYGDWGFGGLGGRAEDWWRTGGDSKEHGGGRM